MTAVTIRNKLFIACESFLRVPPLLLVDEIFRTSFGLGGHLFKYGSLSGSSSQISNSKDPPVFESDDFRVRDEPGELINEASEFLSSDVSSSASQSGLLHTGLLGNSSESISASLTSYLSSFMDTYWIAEEFLKNETLKFIHGSSGENVVVDSAVSGKAINSTLLFAGNNVDEFASATEEITKDLMLCGEVFVSIFLFFTAIVMFMLATENLIKLYSYLLSFLTLYFAYISTPLSNFSFSLEAIPSLVSNLLFRGLLATIFFTCRLWPTNAPNEQPNQQTQDEPVPGSRNRNDTSLLSSWTFLDLLLLSMFFFCGVFHIQPVIFVLVASISHYSLIMSLPRMYNFLLSSWGETKRIQNEYGLSHLIQVESGRLRVNSVFRLFWITRAAYDAFFRCCDEPFSLIIRYVMTHGTETFTGIIGLTVTVAAICHQIGDFLLWILYLGTNNEVDANRFGSISTVLFFILSLQTGLTSLDPEKRLDRLMKNIVLLGTALFHALHQMVAPLLHAFRSFQAVQIRAATVSCTFLAFSFLLTIYVLRWSTISTWSLAVLALAIEFKIKVIISLIISLVVYLSQLVQYPDIIEKFVCISRRVLPQSVMRFFDQLYDQISHEDMVFYLKTFANIAEFITGIFLFVNAVWIFLFESASAIRAIGMSIHAYFNIWCDAQKGIRIYCQRKTASKKIMSLADATEEQIRSRNDDVCSICYEGFESAKVTNCGHLFHAVCLRKWLYVQNTCPMCHEILYKEESIADAPEHHENDLILRLNPGGNNEPPRNQNTLSDDSESEEASASAAPHQQNLLRELRESISREDSNVVPVPPQDVVNQGQRTQTNLLNDIEVQRSNGGVLRGGNNYDFELEVEQYRRLNEIEIDGEQSSSDDDGFPVEEDDGSSGVEIDSDDEDDDHVGLQQNRGLVVFL